MYVTYPTLHDKTNKKTSYLKTAGLAVTNSYACTLFVFLLRLSCHAWQKILTDIDVYVVYMQKTYVYCHYSRILHLQENLSHSLTNS